MEPPKRVRQPPAAVSKHEDRLNRSGPLSSSGPRRVAAPGRSQSAASSATPRKVASPARPASQPAAAKEVSFGSTLSEIAAMSKDPDWARRMESVNKIKELVRGSLLPTERDVRRLAEHFTAQLDESHKHVFSAVLDTMCDFIVIYKEDIPVIWVRSSISRMLLKLGSEMGSATQTKVMYALELFRTSYDQGMQLFAVFKMMVDKSTPQNTKVKIAQMEFVAHLLASLTTEVLKPLIVEQQHDYRNAMQRIAVFSAEPKSAELRRVAIHVLTDMFERDPPAFGQLIMSMPADVAAGCQKVLDAEIGPEWRQQLNRGGGGRGGGSRLSHNRSSTFEFDDLINGSDDELDDADDLGLPGGYNPTAYEDAIASGSPPITNPNSRVVSPERIAEEHDNDVPRYVAPICTPG